MDVLEEAKSPLRIQEIRANEPTAEETCADTTTSQEQPSAKAFRSLRSVIQVGPSALTSIVTAYATRTNNEDLKALLRLFRDPADLINQLGSNETEGLPNDGAAEQRRAVFGANALPVRPPTPFWRLAIGASKDFVLRILMLAGLVSLALGIGFGERRDIEWIEGAAIFLAVVIVVMVTAGNDWIKERQFRTLCSQTLKECSVLRGGHTCRINAEELVVGDVIFLELGEEIPADAVLLNGNNLTVDESSMTGESEAVRKSDFAAALVIWERSTSRINPGAGSTSELSSPQLRERKGPPAGLYVDRASRETSEKIDSPVLLSGCNVASGSGTAIIIAVGPNSASGRLFSKIIVDSSPTALQNKLNALAEDIGRLGLFAACLTLVALVLQFWILHAVAPMDDDIEGGRFTASAVITAHIKFLVEAITIVVVAVPEGLPLAVTLSLAFSVGRMLQDQNYVRRLAACEIMGGASDICSDKTGTLTQNRMHVAAFWTGSKIVEVNDNNVYPNRNSLPRTSSTTNDGFQEGSLQQNSSTDQENSLTEQRRTLLQQFDSEASREIRAVAAQPSIFGAEGAKNNNITVDRTDESQVNWFEAYPERYRSILADAIAVNSTAYFEDEVSEAQEAMTKLSRRRGLWKYLRHRRSGRNALPQRPSGGRNLQNLPSSLTRKAVGSATECAMLRMIELLHYNYDQLRRATDLVHRFDFTSDRKMMTTVVRIPEDPARLRVYVKGAAEIVLRLCKYRLTPAALKPLEPGSFEKIERQVIENMSGNALRTICVAYKDFSVADLHDWDVPATVKDIVGGLEPTLSSGSAGMYARRASQGSTLNVPTLPSNNLPLNKNIHRRLTSGTWYGGTSTSVPTPSSGGEDSPAFGTQTGLNEANPPNKKHPKDDQELKLRNSPSALRGLPSWLAPLEHKVIYKAEIGLTCLGIAGVRDPLRLEVPAAVLRCQEAGIRVRMVTGDNIETAKQIALNCHIYHPEKGGIAMTGAEFMELLGGIICERCQTETCPCQPNYEETGSPKRTESEMQLTELPPPPKTKLQRVLAACCCRAPPTSLRRQKGPRREIARNAAAFDAIADRLEVLARSQPSDKYALVVALQNRGSVVAVTGDGVNDAPALRRADVGFAMGLAGKETARQAADIVLLDDNFESLVRAVKWGRSVYDNIRRFLQFQLTVNFVAVVTALTGAVILRGSPLTAVQLLWINLIMDTLASLALATESPSETVLDRPPHSRTEYLVNKLMVRNIIGQSLYQLAVLIILVFTGDRWIPEKSSSKYSPFEGKLGGFSQFSPFKGGMSLIASGRRYKPFSHKLEYKHSWSVQVGPSRHYTLVFNTFVWLQIFNMFNARRLRDDHRLDKSKSRMAEIMPRFDFARNPLFLAVTLLIAMGQVLLIQFGGRAIECHLAGLTLIQWGISVGFGFGSIILQLFLSLVPTKHIPEAGAKETELFGPSGSLAFASRGRFSTGRISSRLGLGWPPQYGGHISMGGMSGKQPDLGTGPFKPQMFGRPASTSALPAFHSRRQSSRQHSPMRPTVSTPRNAFRDFPPDEAISKDRLKVLADATPSGQK